MASPKAPLPTHYRQNLPGVTCDFADGEVVILNLESGAYYGLDGTGATLWMWTVAGRPVDAIVQAVIEATGAEEETIRNAIFLFFEELAEEQLLVRADSPSVSSDIGDSSPPAIGAEWSTPALNKYTDMNELLLIDPVHEVDDRGWPNLDSPDES